MCERYMRCADCSEQFEFLREVRTPIGILSVCEGCLGLRLKKPKKDEYRHWTEAEITKQIEKALSELICKGKLRVSVDRYGVPSLELNKG